MQNTVKNELQNILSGKSQVRDGATIQAVAGHLGDGSQTGKTAENEKLFRIQETARLESIITDKKLWVKEISASKYIAEGAEQKVFIKDAFHVLKLNTGVFYKSWRDYLFSLLLHNYFFPDTAYSLLGFYRENSDLLAVVQQPYISSDEVTDLNQVNAFMNYNGFLKTRYNDYYNHELGIIVEDLHDENVLTSKGVLYFIDTVFYLTDDLWKPKTNSNT